MLLQQLLEQTQVMLHQQLVLQAPSVDMTPQSLDHAPRHLPGLTKNKVCQELIMHARLC
jgi:hypothetical protein